MKIFFFFIRNTKNKEILMKSICYISYVIYVSRLIKNLKYLKSKIHLNIQNLNVQKNNKI